MMCCDITLICHFVKLIRMISLSWLPVRLQSVSQSVSQSGPGQRMGNIQTSGHNQAVYISGQVRSGQVLVLGGGPRGARG